MITIKATVVKRSVRSQAGNIVGVPPGGDAGYKLVKNSPRDGDATWVEDTPGNIGSYDPGDLVVYFENNLI